MIELLLEARHASIAAAAFVKGCDLTIPDSEGHNAMDLVWRNLSQITSEDPDYQHYRRLVLGADRAIPPGEAELDVIHKHLIDAIRCLGAYPITGGL